jgi:hypothetical protein
VRWALALALSVLPLRAGSEDYRIGVPHVEPPQIESWEFQVLRGAWEPIIGTDGILGPSDACFCVTLSLDSPGWVRARSWDIDDNPSAWRDPIPLPEPGAGAGVSSGVLALALARRRSRRDRGR